MHFITVKTKVEQNKWMKKYYKKMKNTIEMITVLRGHQIQAKTFRFLLAFLQEVHPDGNSSDIPSPAGIPATSSSWWQ